MSIIFYLNKDLLVLKQTVNSFEITDKIERIEGFLNLSDRFENFWNKLSINNTNQIYFILGDEAGFTDTRVLFLWLKSWKIFNPKHQFYINKLDDFINISDYQEMLSLVKKIKTLNNQELLYSKEPRIG